MKARKVESVDSMMKKMDREIAKEKKEHPIKYYSERLYYKVINFLEMVPLEIRTFIQRGKRGYGNSDVWGLHCYLADIIEHSIKDLKNNLNGHPVDLTEGQWVDILNSISDTFNIAKEWSNGELHLIRDKKIRDQYIKLFEKGKSNIRCLTIKEIRNYDLGWKNFKTYFGNLWD